MPDKAWMPDTVPIFGPIMAGNPRGIEVGKTSKNGGFMGKS